jgi:hypothetical protein
MGAQYQRGSESVSTWRTALARLPVAWEYRTEHYTANAQPEAHPR